MDNTKFLENITRDISLSEENEAKLFHSEIFQRCEPRLYKTFFEQETDGITFSINCRANEGHFDISGISAKQLKGAGFSSLISECPICKSLVKCSLQYRGGLLPGPKPLFVPDGHAFSFPDRRSTNADTNLVYFAPGTKVLSNTQKINLIRNRTLTFLELKMLLTNYIIDIKEYPEEMKRILNGRKYIISLTDADKQMLYKMYRGGVNISLSVAIRKGAFYSDTDIAHPRNIMAILRCRPTDTVPFDYFYERKLMVGIRLGLTSSE